MKTVEPEREMIRRVAPSFAPALAMALLLGVAVDGWDAGWSAAIGIAVVIGNFIASGVSVAWAARISPTAMFGVAMGGFIVRLAAIAGVIATLDRLAWFQTATFVAAVVPATILLLVYEARLLSGRMQADLWTVRSGDAHR